MFLAFSWVTHSLIFIFQKEQEEIRRETERKLREELKKEEEIKRKVEEQVLEQKQKADYIRQEAERLLREER